MLENELPSQTALTAAAARAAHLIVDTDPPIFADVQYVFHLAGIGDIVPSIEQPTQYMDTNVQGTVRVLECARQAGVEKFVYAASSSCYGLAAVPTDEDHPINPQYPYALSKLQGEQAVEHAGGEHTIARSSWLFGAGGPNFVETMLRLGGERDAVSVVTDQVGCPTFTGHLAEALVALAGAGPRGLVHVAGGGSCSWRDFAVEIFAQAGVDCRVDAATTAQMARPAPRPAFSVLASERADAPRLPDWREGLAAYLAERAPARASA